MQKLSLAQHAESSKKQQERKCDSTELKSGWALKSPRKASRMTIMSRHHGHFWSIFSIEVNEQVGKLTTISWSCTYNEVKLYKSGKLTFYPEEWRSAKQKARFFFLFFCTKKGQEANADDLRHWYKSGKTQDKQCTSNSNDGHPSMYEDMDLCNPAEKNRIGKLILKCFSDLPKDKKGFIRDATCARM